MESDRHNSSPIQFEKRERDPENISGEWRLATVEEVRNNLQVIKQEGILQSWDIARLLDGWVDGPGYRYTISNKYRTGMGHMIVIKTDKSRPNNNSFCEEMYRGISLTAEGRKAAALLSCEDKLAEVLLWVLSKVENQRELDDLQKSMNETFSNGRTILHYAADHPGNGEHGLAIANLLMDDRRFEYGKELVKHKDKYKRTALHISAFHGHISLCRYLIREGKLKMDETDRNGENPFHFAVSGNRVDIVRHLLSFLEEVQRAISLPDAKGKTALHKAAANGSKGMMEVLLQCTPMDEDEKKYISKPDFLGETALHEAVRGGHTEAVRYLLNHGSSPLHERNADGKTALHYAVQLQNSKANTVAELLLDHLKSAEEKTLFLWASASGIGTAEESAKPAVRNFLQNYKASVSSSDNLLRTAIELDLEQMVWELISRGADTNQIMDSSWRRSLQGKEKQHLLNFYRHIEAMPDRGRDLPDRGGDQPARDDSLGRIHFAEGLAALFLNPFVKTPITVGISGDWGMGKSSLMVQTEIALLKAGAQLAFPNLLQTEKFPGSREWKLSKDGRRKSEKIRRAAKHLFLHSASIGDKDPLVHFLENYQQRYHGIYRSLAVMDRSEMFHVGERSKSETEAYDLGKIPAILTVQYNAWHYQNEFEAWAGLAVEITKVIEETMNTAQTIRTCWRYAWNEQRGKIWLDLILPCILTSFIAGWITWAAWLLISRSNHKELVDLKYGCIPVTIAAIVWAIFRQVFCVMKPISDQIMAYVRLPDHSGNLGYQQKVISDIRFLKTQIGEKPCWLWKFLAGQWCWNWLGLYSDTVKGTRIPKLPPASMDDLRIIVFVDDLDRCQDTIILQVLSAVNLVLAACEINVILGMDKKMIARAIAHKFEHSEKEGDDTMDLAHKYISKIVQLPLALPDPNDAETKKFLDQQLGVVSEERSDEDSHPITAEGIMPDEPQPSQAVEGQVAVNLCQDERERTTGFLSTFWSKVSQLFQVQPWRAFTNCLAQFKQSNGIAPQLLEGSFLNSLLLVSNYSPGEREALSYLRKFATDNQKLPREWKQFLTYHRLAWNILSKSGQVKSLPGWQVQLVVWVFCCWQWRDQMNTIIEKWQELVLIKDDLLNGKGKASDGPSLRNIVEHYIDMKVAVQTETVKVELSNQWWKLKDTLMRYDVSMDCIQAFQKFRLLCEVGHLPWPLVDI